MLMRQALRTARRFGKLIPARRLGPAAATKRTLLMCAPVHDDLGRGRSDPDERVRQRWAALEAAFDHFAEGGRVDPNFLKHLLPKKYEHWTLRNRSPRPGLRVFGRFAEPDVFVATHVVPRSELGDMWSSRYEQEKLVCEQHWKDAGLPEPYSDPPDFAMTSYVTSNSFASLPV